MTVAEKYPPCQSHVRLLLTFPAVIVDAFGAPKAASSFYLNILGAVLVGIAIALCLGRSGRPNGLGLGGAVSIALCGGLVLGLWLLLGDLEIPGRGYVILWLLVVLLVGLSAVEGLAHLRAKAVSGAA